MIRYSTRVDEIGSGQLLGFFVGWPNPPLPETHLRLLRNSEAVVLAIDQESNRVVGFVTAITDGVLCAYVPLLEVLPPYQRDGIGRELMRRMLCQLSGFYMVDLLCESSLRSFYATVGMAPAHGMMCRDYTAQSGRGVADA